MGLTHKKIKVRNQDIIRQFHEGMSPSELAKKHKLTEMRIYQIIGKLRHEKVFKSLFNGPYTRPEVQKHG